MLKVIKAVVFAIVNYEKNILAVGYQNKNNQDQDKWNNFNHMPMQSLLGTNHRLPLSHMAKSYIWLEETRERNNEFSIGYMTNPTLNIRKSFKEQVTKCMKTTFGAITQPHISKILSNKYESVSIINFL